jgi:hypothetical protein
LGSIAPTPWQVLERCYRCEQKERGSLVAVKVNIIEHTAFLEVLVTGKYDLREVADNIRLVFLACRTWDKSKILVDFQNMSNTDSAVEKVLYTHYEKEHYENHLTSGGKKLMIAYLGFPHQISTYEPGLAAAKTYGLPVALFTNKQDALGWLDIDLSGKETL